MRRILTASSPIARKKESGGLLSVSIQGKYRLTISIHAPISDASLEVQ